jgi:flagellar FliJ protein
VARFRFELQAVLDLRERVERDRQIVVAELEAQRVTLEDVIRQCQESLVQERATLRAMLEGSDLRAARQQYAVAGRLTTRAQRAVLELAGVHKRLEAARAALLEASRQRKAVELLRERRYEEWKHARDKAEAAALDELAVMRSGVEVGFGPAGGEAA